MVGRSGPAKTCYCGRGRVPHQGTSLLNRLQACLPYQKPGGNTRRRAALFLTVFSQAS